MTTVTNDDMQLHLLRDALRRRWRLFLACVVVVAGLAAGATYMMTPSYTATSTVLLRPLTGNALDANSANNSAQVTIAMETEAGLVASPEVAALVSRQLGHRIDAGSTQVSALVPTNTETVTISFTAKSAVKAREGAQAFASAFLKSRSDRAQHTIQSQLNEIGTQSKEAQNGLTSASKAAKSKNSDTAVAADAQVQLYASRVSSLEERASQLTASGINPGFVVTPATSPAEADGVRPLFYIVGGALLGLIFGGMLALWRERSSDVIRSDAEDSVSEVPILSLLPTRRSNTSGLLSGHRADESAKDAYRRARVGALSRVGAGSVIAISDLSHTSRAGEVSANLALSIAEAGHRVTLVDASLDGHVATKLMGKEGSTGLSDVLKSEDESLLPIDTTQGMRVLAAGTASSPDMRDLYAGNKFRAVLDRLREVSDLVVVSAPPASSAEGDTVAFSTDGVILILADGQTTHAEVRDTISRDTWLGIHLVGFICESRQHRRGRRASDSAHSYGPLHVDPHDDKVAPNEQSITASK